MMKQNGKRIAVGMSGGVDSSVAALLLREEGWEVIGFSLHMFKEGSRCCSIEDVNRARRICDHIGTRHYTLNVVDRFMDEVIEPFTRAYAEGRTPNPCIYCNRQFKFGVLLERALELDCSHIATGHYVRIESRDGRFVLREGIDSSKDQSYFLHRLTQEQLSRAAFPLGSWKKPDVRRVAAERELPIEGARETADLCFITDAGPAPLIERFHPDVRREGEITDTEGRTLGTHQGIHQFTIGQRGGLGIATGERMYVKSLDPAANRVVVARRESIYARSFLIEDLYWMAPPADGTISITCRIRTRYRQKPVDAEVTQKENGLWHVETLTPVFAVTPGQAAVLYDGDTILGGGWIHSTIETRANMDDSR